MYSLLIYNVLLRWEGGAVCHESNLSEGVITGMNYYLIPSLLGLK